MDLGYNMCDILEGTALSCEMILIKDIVALVLKYHSGSSGICLFFLNVMAIRLVCDILVYPINSPKMWRQ